MAMMGDASDEAYMLTLYADDEEMDITAETAELAVFMNNIEYLFLEGGCTVAHDDHEYRSTFYLTLCN